MVHAKPERNAEIMAMVAQGVPYAQIAQLMDISFSRVGQIIRAERAKLPLRSRDEMIRELATELEYTRTRVTEVLDAAPAPAMNQGKPVPALEPDGSLSETRFAVDRSALLAAADTLTRVQARQAKLLGLDSPDRVGVDQTVRYVIDGVKMDDV